MINETIYGSLITATKCYKCIHFPLCMAQKGGVNLGLASENDCMYFQPKLPDDVVTLTNEEWERLKSVEVAFKEYTKPDGIFIPVKELQVLKELANTSVDPWIAINIEETIDGLIKQYGVEGDDND